MAFSNLPLLQLVFDDDVGESVNKVKPQAKRFGSCNQEQLKDILGSWVPKSNLKVMCVIYTLINVTAVDL